jgi:hypothetical protein
MDDDFRKQFDELRQNHAHRSDVLRRLEEAWTGHDLTHDSGALRDTLVNLRDTITVLQDMVLENTRTIRELSEQMHRWMHDDEGRRR